MDNTISVKSAAMTFVVAVFVRLACAYSNGCKSLTRPYSGKRPATDKGVHREVESEGSLRQISGLTHRNYI